MPHYTTGLPKLDLEPFDATPLYEAAASNSAPEAAARGTLGRRWLWASVVVGALVAVGSVLALVL